MRCPKCSKNNPTDSKFCNDCGQKFNLATQVQLKAKKKNTVHPSVKANYLPRVLIFFIAACCMDTVLYLLGDKFYIQKIVILSFIWLTWPHVAYKLSQNSKDSKKTERRNFLVDHTLAGFFIGIIELNFWPSFACILMVLSSSILSGGLKYFSTAIPCLIIGVLIKFLVLGVDITLESTFWVSTISAIVILLNTALLSISSYIQARRRIKTKKQLKNLSAKISEYLPPQVVQNISNGQMEALSTHHRKKLTIFFSDIKDFTSMTDGMEPEDMANLLNEYFTEMDTIISTYQGTLAQVTGDSLLVLFGAPEQTNDKDHALRCLNMAKDMQNKMKGLQIRWFNKGIDENFMIRCGINTGMATVGTFGSSMRKLYTAHGMQVNLAARLEQACEPGSILISHSTWALVKDEIPCPEKQQINAKGYHKPVRVYEVELDKIKDC